MFYSDSENIVEMKVISNKKSNQTPNIQKDNQDENIRLNFEEKNQISKIDEIAKKNLINAKTVREKVWQHLKETKVLVINAAFFALCSGAVWSAYGILLATTINALQQTYMILEEGAKTAGWFILVAAISGICISLQK